MPKNKKPLAGAVPTAEPTTSESPAHVLMVDSREPDSIPPALTERGVPNERRQLQVGDFYFRSAKDEMIVISRKSSDLMSSVYEGHFQDEIERCINFIESSGGGRLIYLEEGKWAPDYGGGLAYFKRKSPKTFIRVQQTGGDSKALLGIQLSLQAAGLWAVHTADVNETVEALAAIYRRANEGWPSTLTKGLSRPALRWSDDNRIRHLRGLWPGLRESVAEALLDTHGSIRNVLDWVEEDPKRAVKETSGLGKAGVDKLIEVMND